LALQYLRMGLVMSKTKITREYHGRDYDKLPIKDLIDYLDRSLPKDNTVRGQALGLTRNSYASMKRRTEINWTTADRYAINLGAHPALIWSDWYKIVN
jgi:hypothetical protein